MPSKSSGYCTGENLAKSRNSKTCCCFKLQGLPIAEVAPFTFGQDFLLLATEAEVKLGKKTVGTTCHSRGDMASSEAENGGHSEQFCHKDRDREGKPIRIYG